MAIMTHGECLNELWCASRNLARRRSDFLSLAAYCAEQAVAGAPCVYRGMTDYAAVKFIAAQWSEDGAETMAGLFAVYVKHGVIDPNAVLVANDEVFGSHYRRMAGQLPLVQAIAKANLHTAEQLVIHGARTDILVNGLDFCQFTRESYGATGPFVQAAKSRESAAARLLQLAMERRLADRLAERAAPAGAGLAAPPSQRRRAQV